MPTKRNKAGNQQNYVPKGNGDASGEYGDNATGSNKHFTTFAKGGGENKVDNADKKFNGAKETPSVENDVKIEEGVKETTDVKGIDGNKNYVKTHSTYKGEQLKQLHEIIDKGDKDCITLLNNAYGRTNYSFSTGSGEFSPLGRHLKCDKSDMLGTTSRIKGSIWYHENGHLLNWSIQKDGEPQTVKAYGFSMKIRKQVPISSWFKDENDKSLNDYCKEEIKELYKSGKIKEIMNKKEEFFNEELNKLGFDKEYYDEYDKKIKTLSEQRSNELNQIRYDYFDKKMTLMERAKKEAEVGNKYSSEIDKLTRDEKYNQNSSIKTKARMNASKRMFDTYSTISDCYSSLGNSYGFAGGHSANYYKQRPDGIGDEFFANVFSARNVNKDEIEEIKKYMPKSYAMFEKILKEGIKYE